MKRKKLYSFLTLIVLVVVFWFVYTNAQGLKDRFVVATTDISSDSRALKDQLQLTSEGDFLYEASQTELQPAEQFRDSCLGLEQNNIVLGCYTGQRIFVYDIREKKLEGVRQVTAAHELLHAVYERLSLKEQEQINRLLKQQLFGLSDQRIKETIDLYKDLDEAERMDELHAILGTELEEVSPALEKHYAQYFSDRSVITSFAQQYQGQFIRLENQRKAYDREISRLKTQIQQLQTTLTTQKQQLDAKRSEIESTEFTDTQAFNTAVAAFETQRNNYNNGVVRLQQLVKTHNQTVDARNALATAEVDLAKKLDSSVSTQ